MVLGIAICFLPVISFAEEIDETTAQQETTQQTVETESTELNTNEAYADILNVTDGEVISDEMAGNDATQMQILLPNDALFYIGKGYAFAVADLVNSGFTEIRLQENTISNYEYGDGEVLSVSIAGDSNFQGGKQVPIDAPVIVEYYRQVVSELPLNSPDVGEANYQGLLKSLYEAGFINITVDEQYDLDPTTHKGEPTIMMTVGGNSTFTKDIPVPVEIPITVTVHFPKGSNPISSANGDSIQAKNKVFIPFSSEFYMRQNQNDCIQRLMQLGFENVEASAVTDVLWGATQPEQVVAITVDNVQEFQYGDCFDSDVEVVVYYHIPEFKFVETEFKVTEGDILTIPYYVAVGDDLSDITIKVGEESCLEQISPYTFRALKTGTTCVSASYKDILLAECSVNVEPIQIESISTPDETVSVGVGRTENIPFLVSPDNANCTGLEVSSSNPKIVSVKFQEGKPSTVCITGEKEGNATITIQSLNEVVEKFNVSVVSVVPEEIRVMADKNEIYVGTAGALSAMFNPSDVTDQTINWKSSDPHVLKVNSDGRYQALTEGKATITATHSSGIIGEIQIMVEPIMAKELNLHSDWDNAKSFYKNNTMTLTAVFTPENTTDRTISWTSSDETVVTVSPKGIVKAISAGNAIITATTSNGVKQTFLVSVAPSPQAFRISASINMTSNDHVGKNWGTGFTFNGEPLLPGNRISIMPGEVFSVGGWAEEKDSKPDYGAYLETIELTNEMCTNGFTIEGDVDVRENGGRYSGHYAEWHLKIQFTPVN